MANPNRVRNISFSTGRITSKIRGAKTFAMRKVSKEMQADLKKTVGKQGTRKLRSKPGQPPRRQEGDLQGSIIVEVRGSQIVTKVSQIGIWLEGGTGRIRARPFYQPRIRDRRLFWERRMRTEMRKFAKAR